MTRVVACFKWVLDEDGLTAGADGSVDTSRARGKISDYDRNAINAACLFAQETPGGLAAGLTFGDDSSKPALHDALSRGLDEARWVHGECAKDADGALTADVLANSLHAMEDVSLVICAEGSSDQFARQVGPRIAANLDIPCVTSVIEAHFEGDTLIAKRRLDDCLETVSVTLPAVISILPEFCDAPIPGMKAILGAKKKPTVEYDAAEYAGQGKNATTTLGSKIATVSRKGIRIKEDTPAETAKAFVDALVKEGVL